MSPFGWWTGRAALQAPGLRAKVWGAYVSVFGVPELHSHIRLRAVRRAFEPCAQTVELGAGGGSMGVAYGLETGSRCLLAPFTRADASLLRRDLLALSDAPRFGVVAADATTRFLRSGSVDQVLLIDVLEHVRDDALTLRSIHGYLRPGGRLLISVPTPAYPSYFGQEFDARIGHLRHYDPDALQSLLERNGFDTVSWRYYTRPFTARLCRIWYQRLLREDAPTVLARLLAAPVLSLLAKVDQFPFREGDARSASILLVARRRS